MNYETDILINKMNKFGLSDVGKKNEKVQITINTTKKSNKKSKELKKESLRKRKLRLVEGINGNEFQMQITTVMTMMALVFSIPILKKISMIEK